MSQFFINLLINSLLVGLMGFYFISGLLLLRSKFSLIDPECKKALQAIEEAANQKSKEPKEEKEIHELLSFKSQEAKRIQAYFEQGDAYLNKDFGFDELAKDLNMTPTDLRNFMQQEWDVNFYTLIGYFRVKYAIYLMQTKPNYITLNAIMRSSGFRSRSSFVSHFKQNTGLTPSEYRKILDL